MNRKERRTQDAKLRNIKEIENYPIQVGSAANLVRIEFDRPINFLQMPPDTADELANKIKEHADRARRLIN